MRLVPPPWPAGLLMSSHFAIHSHMSAICAHKRLLISSVVVSAFERASSDRFRYALDRLGGLRHDMTASPPREATLVPDRRLPWHVRPRLGTRARGNRLSAMKTALTDLELEILRKLAAKTGVAVPSQLRLRLELAGVIRENAKGIALTAEGRRLAMQKVAPSTANSPPLTNGREAVDKRGRRMPLRRKSIF